MDLPPDFSEVEAALDLRLHPGVKDYYGSFWFGGFQTRCDDEAVLVPGIWNEEHLKSMLASFVDHARTRRLELPEAAEDTFYVASTDSDLFFSIGNHSGSIFLEEPGYKPVKKVAPSLADFLHSLRRW